mmetsp:Transcript_15814/g.34624  ORF Transcript_15814/g.34624 Transcript_15814/m.34624 type:complete len:177 (+) Transcript_15814:96-626(+)
MQGKLSTLSSEQLGALPVTQSGLISFFFGPSLVNGLYTEDMLNEAEHLIARAEGSAKRAMSIAESPDVRAYAETAYRNLQHAGQALSDCKDDIDVYGLGTHDMDPREEAMPVVALLPLEINRLDDRRVDSSGGVLRRRAPPTTKEMIPQTAEGPGQASFWSKRPADCSRRKGVQFL